MTITHDKVATLPDESGKEVNKDEWNAAHVVADDTLVAAKTSFTAPDKIISRSAAGAGAGSEFDCTSAGRALLDDASAAAQRTTLGVGTIATQASDNVSITGGSVTGTTGVVYTLQSLSSSYSPVDAQTVYQGAVGVAPTTTANVYVVPFPLAGTVIRAFLEIGVGGTLGTTETSTVSFRLNNTTDTTITASGAYNAARQQFDSGALSIAVVAGDYFQIKTLHPTWVTNPTGVVHSVSVLVRT